MECYAKQRNSFPEKEYGGKLIIGTDNHKLTISERCLRVYKPHLKIYDS